MISEISPAIEEYLEHIYRLEEKYGVARTKDIVEAMSVSPGTVTNVIKWLKEKGLIVHQPYRGVKLTEEGRRIAIQVLRKHRVAERLLFDLLRVEWERVHELACKLEHGLNEEIVDRLEEVLNYPRRCPHGNLIPNKYGEVFKEETIPMTELGVKERGVVVKVIEESEDILRYLSKLGMLPNVQVEVLEKDTLEGYLTVLVGGTQRTLNYLIASLVHVKRVGGEGS